MYRFIFIIALLSASTSFGAANSNECRNKISEILCLVDPVDESNPFADQYSRPCLEGSSEYLRLFQRHYDSSPALIKKMYCSLEKIWIEKNLMTTAYAVPIREQNFLVAGAIGISKNFLDENPSLAEWLSKKESASFEGENTFSFDVQSSRNMSAVDYALNHEFGHIFDYANNIQEDWIHFSWETNSRPREEFTFPLFKELCFYQCGGGYASQEQARTLFDVLFSSPFISTYASVNAKEDWAETFALYLLADDQKLSIRVKTRDRTYDLKAHMDSERMKEKKIFYQEFRNGKIKYPGELDLLQ